MGGLTRKSHSCINKLTKNTYNNREKTQLAVSDQLTNHCNRNLPLHKLHRGIKKYELVKHLPLTRLLCFPKILE